MNFLYTFPLTDYFAVISLLHGTHDELSSILYGQHTCDNFWKLGKPVNTLYHVDVLFSFFFIY